ncbi:MAG: hypothetical protein LBE12_00595 [Planctomycetaceae bacterium]|jgi:hypothetical protein|nr:hypothetical protein [Planctomycetaceae bacterium]
MYYNQFIDDSFIDYLNRYCTGIVLLKDKIQKISVSYYLSDAYSNYACRFYIKVEFSDYQNLTLEEKKIATEYLYEFLNETGSQFVSFIYRSSRERDIDIDIDVIEKFIYHYEFAVNIFDGFIRKILPQTCLLEIDDLKSIPFFIYMISFLGTFKYSEIENSKESGFFSKKYVQINKRTFEFDCHLHPILKDAATQTLDINKTISDEELHNSGGGDMVALRQFVIDAKIPFLIPRYSLEIDKIQIDTSELKKKLKNYVPKNSDKDIQPEVILKILEKKEMEGVAKKEKLDQKCKAIGIKTGDYIYVKSDHQQVIGVIKEIELYSKDDLKIRYNILKNDLTESRSPLKEISCKNKRFYTLNQEIIEEEKKNASLKTKQQLIAFFNKKGIKNPLFDDNKI